VTCVLSGFVDSLVGASDLVHFVADTTEDDKEGTLFKVLLVFLVPRRRLFFIADINRSSLSLFKVFARGGGAFDQRFLETMTKGITSSSVSSSGSLSTAERALLQALRLLARSTIK